MSRSVRYAIGASLILILIGAGSGYAVARWHKKDAPANWTPDWGAVQRGWSCVTGEVQDVADFVIPDRDEVEVDDVVTFASDPIGFVGAPGDTEAAAETGESGSSSPVDSFLERGRDFLASLSDEVPRLDEPAPTSGNRC